ncbi:MAG TPA: glycosyltransferase [Solirubrobacteraceae bacterium]|jgi:glycosyltransferase involved in cell wall biosynthesis
MDVALHWHGDWPEYLQPLLSALEGLPEAEDASDGSLLFCPDAGAMAPPKSSDAALVALVPEANAALDPHRAQLLGAALAGWSERGALFATPTMSAALGLRLMLGLSTDRVAVLPLPLPPARVPTCPPRLGRDVLAVAPIAYDQLLGALEVMRLADLAPRLVLADPGAGRWTQAGGTACAYDLLPGHDLVGVDDWRAAADSAAAIFISGIGTGLGWTLRQALATGRPVVAPSLPVVRDHLSAIGADAYLYVPPFDARRVAQALTIALRRGRGEGTEVNARDAVLRESYADSARVLLGLFHQAVRRPDQASRPTAAAAAVTARVDIPAAAGPRVEMRQRLEVCVLNPNPSGGGGERFMRQLVGGMAGHASQPRIRLVCQLDLNAAFDPGVDAMRQAGIGVHIVDAGQFPEVAAREIAGADVAYYSWPHQSEPPATSVPLACTFHDLNWKHFDVISDADKLLLERQTPHWIDQAAAVVHSSHFIREELHRYYEAPRSLTHVIPIAADPPPIPPAAAELERVRRRFTLPERFLLSPNGFHLHKNYPALSAALRILRHDGRPVHVIATGAATERYNGPDLVGLGYISARELQAIYEQCAGVVQTTLYEAGSFPMAEAMIARKPVAISRIPPIVEQVERVGVVAELFDPLDPRDVAEAVWRIWNGSEATDPETIAANADAVAARTWDGVAGDYLALLGSLPH